MAVPLDLAPDRAPLRTRGTPSMLGWIRDEVSAHRG